MSIFILASSESNIMLPPLKNIEYTILIVVLLSAFIALAYGAWLIVNIFKADQGSKAMQDVAKAIQEGANAYLFRQFKTMMIFVIYF
jgi:K(+)-stimulated pyrophosphate-energized sodium pump